MHILGKISAWLAVIAAGAALGLSAKLFEVRGGYLKQVSDLKASNEKNAETLVQSRKALSEAEAAYSSEILRWGRFWSPTPATVAGQGADLTLNADIGSTQKLGYEADKQPVVHAFMLSEDESSSKYIGPFQATEVSENASTLKPAFRVRPDEPSTWTGQKWRFRLEIPDGHKTRFNDLESQLVTADERVGKENRNLEIQTGLVETAKQHLAFRMGELLGGENQKTGLVAEIEQAEVSRDGALSVVDDLRRAISNAVARLNELAAANRELVEKLSTAVPRQPNETADARRD
jgi:hypothetical protein